MTDRLCKPGNTWRITQIFDMYAEVRVSRGAVLEVFLKLLREQATGDFRVHLRHRCRPASAYILKFKIKQVGFVLSS